MKLIAIAAVLLLALSSAAALAQVALSPKWDVKAANDRLTASDRAMAKRFQDAPWVAPDTRVRLAVRPEPAK